jgi:hypothetical protein
MSRPVSRRSPLRDAAWAIVKDAKGMEATGHGAAVRWARALLELDESGVLRANPRVLAGHTCGWAADVDGTWRCVQDFYAVGYAPETGCGATWP